MYELSLLEYLLFCTGFGVWFIVSTFGIGAALGLLCYHCGKLGAMRWLAAVLTGVKVWGNPDDPEVKRIAIRRLRELRETSLNEWRAMNCLEDEAQARFEELER